MATFTVNLKEVEEWDEFQSSMNEYFVEVNKEIQKMATELNVSIACAQDVWYLRSRSRHTQELENQLIQLHRDGNPPNICEFGCS